MLSIFFWASGLYLVVGLVFAVYFVRKGVERVDAAAIGAPWGFRTLIFPGSVALWPILLRKVLVQAGDAA